MMQLNRLISLRTLFAAAALFVQSGAATAQSIVAEIPFTNTCGTCLAVNPVTNKIYVASSGTNGSISFLVIDGDTNKVTATIPDPDTNLIGYFPYLAVNSRTNQIYVVHLGLDFLVIDGVTNQTTKIPYTTHLFEPKSVGFVVDEASNKAYFLARQDQALNSEVAILDGTTSQVTIVSEPHMLNSILIRANPSSNKVYVLNAHSGSVQTQDSQTSITVIDGPTNHIRNVALSPYLDDNVGDMVVDPVSDKLYISEIGSAASPGNLIVLDGAARSVTNVSVPGFFVPPPGNLVVNPAVNKLYVSYSYFPDSTIFQAVTVIDLNTNQMIATIPVTTVGPYSGYFDSLRTNTSADAVYVSLPPAFPQNYVNIMSIDGRTNEARILSHPQTSGSFMVAANPVTNRVYTTSTTDLTVVDPAISDYAAFSLSESNISFGARPIGLEAIKHITVTNTGTLPVDISSVDLTGPNANDFGITDNTCQSSVPAGHYCTFIVHFHPSAIGLRHAVVTVTSPQVASQQIVLSGPGHPPLPPGPLSFNPPLIEWGPLLVGEGAVVHIHVTNPNPGTTATLSGITITGANPTDFQIDNQDNPHICPAVIPYSGGTPSCEVDILFIPIAVGGRTANVTFADNGTNPPQIVPMSGPVHPVEE